MFTLILLHLMKNTDYRMGRSCLILNALYFLACEIKISPQKFAGFE